MDTGSTAAINHHQRSTASISMPLGIKYINDLQLLANLPRPLVPSNADPTIFVPNMDSNILYNFPVFPDITTGPLSLPNSAMQPVGEMMAAQAHPHHNTLSQPTSQPSMALSYPSYRTSPVLNFNISQFAQTNPFPYINMFVGPTEQNFGFNVPNHPQGFIGHGQETRLATVSLLATAHILQPIVMQEVSPILQPAHVFLESPSNPPMQQQHFASHQLTAPVPNSNFYASTLQQRRQRRQQQRVQSASPSLSHSRDEGVGVETKRVARRTSLSEKQKKEMFKWVYKNRFNPKPRGEERERLMRVAGMSRERFKTWFANARRRYFIRTEVNGAIQYEVTQTFIDACQRADIKLD
ncbi:hypothetical protein LPJ66_007961 [Kickxella alabastrina]|uniref:Uncharacterized protein n=1 Tax=Kickxella alabastrina TaxID=61397 RepID=A0ACC1I7Y2_9FUNG|nr:hypothetical protein LPJ66_007961 [Kickxella alabastrina]